MKIACDHFHFVTTAEILRAANYQSDLMAVRRRERTNGAHLRWGTAYTYIYIYTIYTHTHERGVNSSVPICYNIKWTEYERKARRSK